MDSQVVRSYKPPADLLAGRTILITGAAAGIGRAVSLACAAHGATVVLLDRTIPLLESLYDEIVSAGYSQPALYPLNLEGANVKDYAALVEKLDQEFGSLGGLVNNAAWIGGLTELRNYKVETWSRSLTVNLHAPFLLTRACIPLLEKAGDAAILFSTDACARAYWGAYGIAKHAQLAMMNILADELDSELPVRVNGLDTGPVRTGLRTQNYPGDDPAGLPAPEDVTNGYLYFLGRDSVGVTGQNVRLADE